MSLKASVARPFNVRPERIARPSTLTRAAGKQQIFTENVSAESTGQTTKGQTAFLGATGLLTPILLDVQNALAQKGEYGIVEGRIASMTHPVLMGFLFGASVYTGWLGFQWRYYTYGWGNIDIITCG